MRIVSQLIIMLSGVGLIVFGAIVSYNQAFAPQLASAVANAAERPGFLTNQPGLGLVVLGVILELVGFFSPRWMST
jgi:hypothetical protein